MTQRNRIIIYVLILTFVLLIAWLGTPNYHYKPRGLVLPTEMTQFSPIPVSKVSIDVNQMVSGTVVGLVNVQYYAPKMGNSLVITTERYAASLAAAHGANQLLITEMYRDPEGQTIHFSGKAIHG